MVGWHHRLNGHAGNSEGYSHEIKKTLAPWKESYDKPRLNIKKQRHYYANKGPHSQNYGFSSSHVWM